MSRVEYTCRIELSVATPREDLAEIAKLCGALGQLGLDKVLVDVLGPGTEYASVHGRCLVRVSGYPRGQVEEAR
jgi:hypothetical protein